MATLWAPNHFSITGELLTDGTYESLCGRAAEDDRPIAVKYLRIPDSIHQYGLIVPLTFAIRTFREIACLMYLVHPAIVPLSGWSLGRPVSDATQSIEAQIITEFLDGGNLYWITGALKPFERILISYGIARGMEFCESRGISHRDLRPENIMLDSRGYPRIANFHCAKTDRETDGGDEIGTPMYTPPDVGLDDRGLSRDLYAYGCMTCEILCGRRWYQKRIPDFRDRFPEIREAFALCLPQGMDICQVLELSIYGHRHPEASFSRIVQTWESIIPWLDEEARAPILAYKKELDEFKPPRLPYESTEIRDFLTRLSDCEEVQYQLQWGPELSTNFDCVAAVLAYTANDDGCDNFALLEALSTSWEQYRCLDPTELISRDERVREGYGGPAAITRYAVHLMATGVEAREKEGCEVLEALGKATNSPEVFFTLGEFYHRTHRDAEALVWFEKCQEADPTQLGSFLACADICAGEGRLELARDYLEAAFAIETLTPETKEVVQARLEEVNGAISHRPVPAS
jgi:serine/threonine protein kinase